MTGNDIVDIATAAAESNWHKEGFLEKIFTAQEQEYILTATAPDEMVWKLWSMKESAYKIYTRQYGGRFFSPKKISCTLITASAGRVLINNTCYHTITNISKKYIYSIARPMESDLDSFMDCRFPISQTDNKEKQQFIYNKLISYYAKVSGKEKKTVEIIKDRNGIPFLHCSRDNSNIPVSITHHGNYAAFTIY